MSRWTNYKDKWKSCEACDLCKTRSKVVLFRGKIPCDFLFIGEAPGLAENILGTPFVGPAGTLLDQIIERSIPKEEGIRLGFTNLVSCIPLDDRGKKVKEPKKQHIQACKDRLLELVKVARPKQIIAVGKLSAKHLPTLLEGYLDPEYPIVEITHPSFILQNPVQRDLHISTTEVRLSSASTQFLGL